MKRSIILIAAMFAAAPLSAQSLDWDLSPVTSSLERVVPTLLGIFCFVALFGWTVWNLIQNWKDRAEILTNAGWALLIIAVGYGIVYGAMQILL